MESEIWGYIGQAAYTLGGLLIGWLWRSLKVSRKEYALIREGVCALLRDRLLYRLEKCLDGGYCSTEMRQDIDHMFYVYTKLGGNGVIPPLRKRVYDLPLEKKR